MWCGVVWCGVVWCVVPCRAVPCRAVSCRVVSCRAVSCRVVARVLRWWRVCVEMAPVGAWSVCCVCVECVFCSMLWCAVLCRVVLCVCVTLKKPVRRFKTSPCVRSKRLRVYQPRVHVDVPLVSGQRNDNSRTTCQKLLYLAYDMTKLWP